MVRDIPFKLRVTGFLFIFYLFGVLELLSFGYSPEGFIYFMVVILRANTLTNRKGGWTAFLVSFVTLAFFGWQIAEGFFTPLAVDQVNMPGYQSLQPAPVLITFAAGAAGLGITIATMWTTLTSAWQREKQATNLLKQERDFLDQRVKERARELAESETKYRTLVEQLPVVVYQDEADEERRNIYLSPQIESVLGYSLAEFEQDPDLWDKIVYPEDYEFAMAIAGEIIARGYSNSEYRLVKRDGSIVWFHDEAVLVRDETNQIQFIQGIMQDITPRKQAESALHQSETRYRALFEDSPISLWEEDLSEVKKRLDSLRGQGVRDFQAYLETHPEVVYQCLDLIKVMDVNKATLQLYGVSDKTEMLGKLPSILSGPGLAAFQTELTGIAEGKSHFEWTGQNLTLDGEEMEVQLSTSALPGYEVDLSRVIISVMDITKLKNAEMELNRRNRQLESLHHVSLELLNRRKMDDLLQSIVDQAVVLMEAPYCEIMLEENGELVVRACTTNQPYLKGDRVGRDQSRLAWQAYDSGEPVIMDDYADWSGQRHIYDKTGLQSVADFPILINDRCLGVLGIARNQAGYPFDEQQIQIGKQFAQITALVLNNLQLLDNSSLQAAALNAAANTIMMTDQQGTIQWVKFCFYKFNRLCF